MELKEQIKKTRKSMRLTQAAFAEKISVDKGTVSRMEQGQYHPSINMLLRISKLTGAKFIIKFTPK